MFGDHLTIGETRMTRSRLGEVPAGLPQIPERGNLMRWTDDRDLSLHVRLDDDEVAALWWFGPEGEFRGFRMWHIETMSAAVGRHA